jgi:hypothetical protein
VTLAGVRAIVNGATEIVDRASATPLTLFDQDGPSRSKVNREYGGSGVSTLRPQAIAAPATVNG